MVAFTITQTGHMCVTARSKDKLAGTRTAPTLSEMLNEKRGLRLERVVSSSTAPLESTRL